jgi:uncharacterized protein
VTNERTADVEVLADPDSAFFWEGTTDGRLLAQRCTACRRLWHPPSPVCPHCQHLEWSIEDLPHSGTLHSVAKVHEPGSPIQGSGYLICLVDLADLADPADLADLADQGHGPGVRMVANLRGCELGDAVIGASVELVFEELAGTFQLPQFKLAL